MIRKPPVVTAAMMQAGAAEIGRICENVGLPPYDSLEMGVKDVYIAMEAARRPRRRPSPHRISLPKELIDKCGDSLNDFYDSCSGASFAEDIARTVLAHAFPDAEITIEVAQKPDSPPPQRFVF